MELPIKLNFNEIFKSRKTQLLLVIFIISLFLTIYSPAFLTVTNIRSVLMGMSYDLVVSLGMTILLIMGCLDLSVGSNMALTSVVTALLMTRMNFPVFVAVILGLMLSGFVGLINGIFVTKFKINPFIVTLAMMSIARGFARVLTGGYFVTGLPQNFLFIGRAEFLRIPFPVIFSILLVILLNFFLENFSPLFRSFYVGSAPNNAELFGINVSGMIIAGFIICGILSGISAIFMSSRLAMGYSQFGMMVELRALGASIIGGASFSGGKGSIVGTFLGVLLLALVRNFFSITGIPIYWQNVVNGIILIIAVATFLPSIKN